MKISRWIKLITFLIAGIFLFQQVGWACPVRKSVEENQRPVFYTKNSSLLNGASSDRNTLAPRSQVGSKDIISTLSDMAEKSADSSGPLANELVGDVTLLQVFPRDWPKIKQGILNLEKLFPVRMGEEQLSRTFGSSSSITVVLKIGDRFVGYISGRPLETFAFGPGVLRNRQFGQRDTVYVNSFVILDEYQGRGWGTQLRRKFLDIARSRGYRFVSGHVQGSVAEAMAFEVLSRHKNWEGSGETFVHFLSPVELQLARLKETAEVGEEEDVAGVISASLPTEEDSKDEDEVHDKKGIRLIHDSSKPPSKDPRRGRERWLGVVTQDEADSEPLVLAAEEAFARGEVHDAIRLVCRALDSYPDNELAASLLDKILLHDLVPNLLAVLELDVNVINTVVDTYLTTLLPTAHHPMNEAVLDDIYTPNKEYLEVSILASLLVDNSSDSFFDMDNLLQRGPPYSVTTLKLLMIYYEKTAEDDELFTDGGSGIYAKAVEIGALLLEHPLKVEDRRAILDRIAKIILYTMDKETSDKARRFKENMPVSPEEVQDYRKTFSIKAVSEHDVYRRFILIMSPLLPVERLEKLNQVLRELFTADLATQSSL
ncbi:GNAT family N-acetyltransferase [Candidatus Auribacterota bacterium]